MTTPQDMATILAAKLSDAEFMHLQELMDSDPPAGPLYEAVSEIALRKHPEIFGRVTER